MDRLRALNTDAEDFGKSLQTLKLEFELAWAAAAPSAVFRAHGKLWSAFADLSIDQALRAAWTQELAAQRHKPVPLVGLFVLGLGKLGGNDLNFSSDVDLIAFYDAQTLPISANKGQKYVINKVLQRLSRLLKPNHSAHFVWRVDWRLRPESSAGSLAISTDEAQNFYFFRALPWHRLALLKARVVGGDAAAGETFLSEITPFIWRQNLDFRALDELAHLKSRINLEHPGLQSERAQTEPITPDAAGFNVKLGAGGIREIEFIANAQQLVWGGKQYELRTTNTLAALDGLISLGHITAEDGAALQDIYMTLRRLENAIQMLENAQTHIVPADEESLAAIATLLGQPSWNAIETDLFTQRQRVNAAFCQLFDSDTTSPKEAPTNQAADLPELSPKAQEIARSWQRGFSEHGVSRDHMAQFRPLGETLLARVIGAATDTETALIRIDQFLQTLSRSEQYFRLMQQNPKLLDALITPLLYSPHMTVLLEQSPHIIDVFLDPQSVVNGSPAPDASFVFADPDYETRLERLRRFVNENLFQYYHMFLEGEPEFNLPLHLTALADRTLDAAIQIVSDDLGVSDVPISVLGLGKMGTRKMAPMSDLDLIFIFDDAVDSTLSEKFVRRLRTAITTPLREGIAYELDMRLRPSGRSGPPAVKLSSLRDYHMSRAKTWEHIALIHSRVVAGDAALGETVAANCAEILARPRYRNQCLTDAMYMHSRLEEERFTKTPHDTFNTKLRRGGLMEADFLWRSFELAGIDPPKELLAARKDWGNIELWERLLALTGQTADALPKRFKAPLKAAITPAQNKGREQAVAAARKALFAARDIPSRYEMRPIMWTDT